MIDGDFAHHPFKPLYDVLKYTDYDIHKFLSYPRLFSNCHNQREVIQYIAYNQHNQDVYNIIKLGHLFLNKRTKYMYNKAESYREIKIFNIV